MYPLHEETLSFVSKERSLTGLVIKNLQKIFEQKIFLRMGYPSMFEYCTKALGYSESCAYRRIAASKLAKEIPEIIEKLNTGALNLTNITMMQCLSSSANMSLEQKIEVLEKIENCSKREAQEILANYFPDEIGKVVVPKESIQFLSADEVALQVRLSGETLKKLDRIRKLRAHKNPSMNYAELIEDMCDFVLNKIDPSLKLTPRNDQHHEAMDKSKNGPLHEDVSICDKSVNPRYVSEKLKVAVYQRDQSRCAFVDKNTGHRCNSEYLLQIDHIQPISRGGQSELENLQLLCHAHHRYRDQYV